MLKSENRLLHDLKFLDRRKLSMSFEQRYGEVYAVYSSDQSANTVGTIATMLFVAGLDDISITPTRRSSMTSLFYSSKFQEALLSAEGDDPLLQLVVKSVVLNDKYGHYQSLRIGSRFKLKATLIRAREVIGLKRIQPYIRQEGVLTIAKMGNHEDVAALETLFDEQGIVSRFRGSDKRTYVATLGDIALAAAVHLEERDLKKFGFVRARPRDGFYVSGSLGFANKSDRDESRRLWKKSKDEAPKEASKE